MSTYYMTPEIMRRRANTKTRELVEEVPASQAIASWHHLIPFLCVCMVQAAVVGGFSRRKHSGCCHTLSAADSIVFLGSDSDRDLSIALASADQQVAFPCLPMLCPPRASQTAPTMMCL